MRKPDPSRRPESQPGLPHEQDRDARQPYAKELEDYRHGVAAPPEEQVGPETHRDTKRERPSK